MKKLILAISLLFSCCLYSYGQSFCHVQAYYLGPVCIGGTLQLKANHFIESDNLRPFVNQGPYVYSWTGPGGFTSSQKEPRILNATTAMAGTYTVSATDTTQCTTTATVTVVIKSLPTVSVTQQASYCMGGVIDISASASGGMGGPYNYYWTSPNPEFYGAGPHLQLGHADTTMNGTYTAHATDGNGCTGSDTMVVQLIQLPKVTATGNGSICAGDTVKLAATGGLYYTWYGPRFFSETSSSPTIPNAQNLHSGNYVVTAYDEHGCYDTASTNVLVKQVKIGYRTTKACRGESNGTATAWSSKRTLYGVGTYFGMFSSITIDSFTQELSIDLVRDSLGEIPPDLQGFSSMTSNAAGEVYAIRYERSLYKVDFAHRTSSYVGEIYACAGEITALVFDPAGILYGADRCGYLFTVDLDHVANNQVPTNNVSNLGYQFYITGMAINPLDGSFWACSQNVIFKIDPLDQYKVINLNEDGTPMYFAQHLTDIAFDGMGMLYIMDCEVGQQGTLWHQNRWGSYDRVTLYDMTTLFSYASPATFLWSNGQTKATATGLAAGLYSVTVTDEQNCPATQSVRVYENTLVTLTATLLQKASCSNACNGAIKLTPAGGTGSYVYSDFYDFSGDAPLEQDFYMLLKNYAQTDGALAEDQMYHKPRNAIVGRKQYDPGTDLDFEISITGDGTEKYFGFAREMGDRKEDYVLAFHKGRNGLSAWESGGQHEEYLNGFDYDPSTWYDYKIEKRGTVIRYLMRIHGEKSYTLLYTGNVNTTFYNGMEYVNPPLKAGILRTETAYNAYLIDNLRITYQPQTTGLCPGTYTYRVRDSLGCQEAIATITVPVNTGIGSLKLTTAATGTCAGGCNGAVALTPSGGTGPYTYGFSNAFAGDQIQEDLFDFNEGDFSQFGALKEGSGYNNGWNNSITVKQDFDGSGDIYFEGSFNFHDGLYGTTPMVYLGFFDPSLSLSPDGIRLGFFFNGRELLACGNNTRMNNSSYVRLDSWVDLKVEKKGNKLNYYMRDPSYQVEYVLVYSMINTMSISTLKAGVLNDGKTSYNYSWYNGYSTRNWSIRSTPKTTGLCAGSYTYTVSDTNGCSANAEAAIPEDVPFPVTPVVTDADFTCNGSVNFTTTYGKIVQAKVEHFMYTFQGSELDLGNFGKLRMSHGNFTVSGGSLKEGLHPNNTYTWDNSIFSNYPVYEEDTLTFEYSANFQLATYATFGLTRYPGSDRDNANFDFGIQYSYGELYAIGGGYQYRIGDCTPGEWHDFRIEKTPTVANFYIRRQPTGNFELLYSLPIAYPEITQYYVGVSDYQVEDPERTGGYATKNWKVYGASPVTNLCPNNYSYTVRNDKGCASDVFFTVSGSVYLQVDEHAEDPTCFGGYGSVSFDISGGLPPYQISFDNGANFYPMEGYFQGPFQLTSGTYNMVFRDKINTYASKNTVLTDPPRLPSAITVNGNSTFCQGGSVQFNANTGEGLTFYEWWLNGVTIPGATSSSYTATQSGVYNVWVGNPECVSKSEPVTVTVNTPPAFTSCPGNVTLNTSPNACSAPASFAVTVSGMPAPTMTYTLSGATIANGTGTGSGALYNKGLTYVTIKAMNECGSATCTFTVNMEDHTKPTVVTKNLTLLLDPSGAGSIAPAQIDNGSTDACGIASYSLSKTQFSCMDIGSNPVSLTVTDNNGNTASANATVMVMDQTPPVARTRNITVQLDATGHAGIVASDVENGSTDACGIASMDIVPKTFDCSNVGLNVVTLTVTDRNGNSSAASATVAVEDHIAPVAKAHDILVQLDASGNVSITPGMLDDGSADACGILTMSLDKSSFNCTQVGANVVTLTVTDKNHNTSASSATVMVEDHVAPTAKTHGITIQLDASGNGSATAEDVNNGSFDACGIRSLDLNKTKFDCSNLGPNDVVLTVSDKNGNSSTAHAIITVEDHVAPVARAHDLTISLNAGGNASITPDMVDDGSGDACGIVSMSVAPNTFTCLNVGPNLVTLTSTDRNGNASSANATVTVKDVTTPVVITQNITLHLDASGNAALGAAQVDHGSSDACGIASMKVTPSSFTCSDAGVNTVTLSVTDRNGNTGTGSAVVTVIDDMVPTAKAKDITLNLNPGGTVSISASQVNDGSSDNCAVASMNISTNSFDCSNLGVNAVTLTVMDVSGNTATAVAHVTVKDVTPPTVLTKNITVYLSATGFASIVAADVNDGSSDHCGIASMSVFPGSFDCEDIGANVVTLTVTDVGGNLSTKTAVVTILDVTPPSVVTKNINATLVGGSISIMPSQVDNGSSDACGIKTMTLSKTNFTCANIGGNQVTLTVTDNHGNTSTGNALVNVVGVVPSVNIGLTPGNNTYTGGDPSRIYLGYGPQTVTLTATGSGAGPFTYSWSGASTISSTSGSSIVFTPSGAGTYYIRVAATNSYGCTASAMVGICVIDIRSGNGKVYLCHAPPGNPDNRQTLSISTNALPSHLGEHSGDRLGTCGITCGYSKTESSGGPVYTEGEINLVVYPNPSKDLFSFKLESTEMTEVVIRIFDMTGKLVLETSGFPNEEIRVDANDFANGIYNAEVSQGDFRKAVKVAKVN